MRFIYNKLLFFPICYATTLLNYINILHLLILKYGRAILKGWSILEIWCNSYHKRVQRFSYGMIRIIGMMNYVELLKNGGGIAENLLVSIFLHEIDNLESFFVVDW